jgi:membrane protein involved in D-alanine export
MRFLLAAAKGKWFKSKHTSSYLGLFLTFGLMGVWHGPHWYYWLYGVYHAALLSGYDWFARWNKTRNYLSGGKVWDGVNILLTFHSVALGLLLFSGRLEPKPLPEREEVVEKLTCDEISGYVWNRNSPNTPAVLDISMDGHSIGRVTANELREELVERGMGNGRYGFHLALPTAARDGKEHWVIPVIVGTPARVISGPDVAEPYKVRCQTPEHEETITPAPATPAPR